MKKREINLWDYAGAIAKAVEGGALITAQAGGRANPMTIGWGTLGIQWNTPIFVAYVRQSRYTRQLLDETMEFTVNVAPEGGSKQVLGYCGTKSGRDVDKAEALGLTLVPGDCVAAPGILEFPLTLECKVIYKQPQDLCALDESKMGFYPVEADGSQDGHIAYYGQVVKAYVLEDA